MKIHTNEVIIAKRKKQAGIVTTVALVALAGGLVVNFISTSREVINPLYIWATITLLAVGFIAATISSNMVNHWVKEPRPDQFFVKALKGLDNRYVLFNYTSAIPHVLLSQNTIYALMPKLTDGEISVTERKWRRKFKASRLLRFFGEEGLGNPTVEAEHQQQKLTQLVHNNITNGDDLTIETLIIFTDPNAQLTLENPTMPVVPGKQLKKYLRQESQAAEINREQRQQLIALLQGPETETKAKNQVAEA